MKVRYGPHGRKVRLARDGLILLAVLLFWYGWMGYPYFTARGAFHGAEDTSLLDHSAYVGVYEKGEGEGYRDPDQSHLAVGLGEGEARFAWLGRRQGLWYHSAGAGRVPMEEDLTARKIYSHSGGAYSRPAGNETAPPEDRVAHLELFYLITTTDPAVASLEAAATVTLEWKERTWQTVEGGEMAVKETAAEERRTLAADVRPVGEGVWLASFRFRQTEEGAPYGLLPEYTTAGSVLRVTALDAAGRQVRELERMT